MDGQATSPVRKSQVRPYGQKAPFSRGDVEAIRARLKVGSRDRCLFELAICSALRAGDLLGLRVGDIQDGSGAIRTRANLGQRKTGKGVLVNITPPAQEALAAHIETAELTPSSYLFTAHRRRLAKPLTVEGFRQLVKGWADVAGHRDVSRFAAHTTRRTLAAVIYSETRDIAAVRHVLGHGSTAATSHYLGVDVDAALAIARRHAL
jgi:integrase